MLVGELLDPVLVDDVPVRGAERVGEAEIDLLLARPGLALGALDLDAGCLHVGSDGPDEALVVACGEHVVVEVVGHRGCEVLVALGVRLRERLLEEVELKLGPEHGLEPERPGALDLVAKHLAWRRPDRVVVVPRDVAEHEGGRLQPGDPAQGGEIGHEVEVAEAALPAGHRVTGSRVHLHIHREQVVAALDRLTSGRAGKKVLGIEALPHQPPLHVGEGGDDCVDRTALDLALELLDGQHQRRARETKRSNSSRAQLSSPESSSGWHCTATIRPSSDSIPSTVPSSPRAVVRRPGASDFTA